MMMNSFSESSTQSLRKQVASLLVIGFEGDNLDNHYIQSLCRLPQPGGLIAFDLVCDDVNISQKKSKNIVNHKQLLQLNSGLRSLFPESLISIDSEGGVDWTKSENGDPIRYGVNRLKVDAGFPATLCAYQIGELYRHEKLDAVKQHCYEIAKVLSDLKFNCVYAPVMDIHNNDCPIIGAMHRSYSSCYDELIACAKIFISTCQELGIQTCLKHYPGHGSALGDTHLGQVDITQQWSENELEPFHALANQCGMVMMSHVIHRGIDDQPVSLSKTWIDRLRASGFDGVIISDDIQMAAATQTLSASSVESLDELVLRAFLAGNDMVIIGGQLSPLPISAYQQLVESLSEAVASNQWPIDSMLASVERVERYKQHLTQANQLKS